MSSSSARFGAGRSSATPAKRELAISSSAAVSIMLTLSFASWTASPPVS